MGDVPETAYDKTIRKLKNNKFIVILLLLFVCFTALVKLLDGWQTIGSVFVQNDDLDTSIVTEQPVVTPIDTVLEPINPPATVVVDSPSSPEVIIKQQSAPSSNQLYSLSITTTPTEAQVFIEGEFKGNSDRTEPLHAGSYEIVLKKEGYQTYTDIINVPRDKILTHDFKQKH
jgi:hypothetical protein